MLLIFVLGVWLAGIERPIQQQALAIAQISAMGGAIEYEYWGLEWLPDRYRKRATIVRVGAPFATGATSGIDALAIESAPSDPFHGEESTSTGSTPAQVKLLLRQLSNLPFLHTIEFSDVSTASMAQDLPNLQNVTKLRLTNGDLTSQTDFEFLQRLPRLTNLTVNHVPVSDEGLNYVSRCHCLQFLNLAHTEISDSGLRHLAECVKLTKLDVSCTQVHGHGMEHLRELESLRVLKIGDGNGGVPGSPIHCCAEDDEWVSDVLALLDSQNNDEVRTTRVGPEAFELVSFSNFVTLVSLDLTCVNTNAGEWKQLRTLRNVESLCLQGSNIDDDTLDNVSHIESIQWLNVADTNVTGRGVLKLSELPNLTTLNAERAQFGRGDVCRIQSLTQLQTIYLEGADIRGGELRVLASLRDLKYLRVANCGLTDQSIADLKCLHQLEYLDISRNPITKRGVSAIERSLPDTKVISQ